MSHIGISTCPIWIGILLWKLPGSVYPPQPQALGNFSPVSSHTSESGVDPEEPRGVVHVWSNHGAPLETLSHRHVPSAPLSPYGHHRRPSRWVRCSAFCHPGPASISEMDVLPCLHSGASTGTASLWLKGRWACDTDGDDGAKGRQQ